MCATVAVPAVLATKTDPSPPAAIKTIRAPHFGYKLGHSREPVPSGCGCGCGCVSRPTPRPERPKAADTQCRSAATPRIAPAIGVATINGWDEGHW